MTLKLAPKVCLRRWRNNRNRPSDPTPDVVITVNLGMNSDGDLDRQFSYRNANVTDSRYPPKGSPDFDMASQLYFGGLLGIGQLQRNLADYCLNRMERRSMAEQLRDFSDLMGTTLSYHQDYKDNVYKVTYEIGLVCATIRGSDELDCMNRCKTEILYKLKVFSLNGEDGSTPPTSAVALTPLTSSLPAVEKSRVAKREEINGLDGVLEYCDGIENVSNPTSTAISPKTRSDRTAAVDDIVFLPANDENQETKPVDVDDRNRKIELSQASSDHVEEKTESTEKTVELEPIELQQASNSSGEIDTDTFPEQNLLIPTVAAALDSSDGIVEANFDSDKTESEKKTGSQDESFVDKSVTEGTENHSASPCALQNDEDATATNGMENVPVSASPCVLQDEEDATATNETENVPVSTPLFPLQEETEGPTMAETEDAIVSTSPPLQDDNDKDRTVNVDLPENEVVKENENNDIERESVIGDLPQIGETNTENEIARHDDNNAPSTDVHEQDPMNNAADLPTAMSCDRQPATAGLLEQFIDDVSRLLNNLTVNNVSMTAESLLILLVAANDIDKSYPKFIVDVIVNTVVDDVADNCVLYASLCSKISIGASNSEKPGVRNVVPVAFKLHLIDSCFFVLWGTKHDEQHAAGDNRPMSPEPSAAVEFDLELRIRSLIVCRFLGELFVLDDIKIYFPVSRMVQKLMQSCDDRCLECLCVLLMTAGPKLKKITKTKKTHYTLHEIYDKLERCATLGRSDESLPKRTVSMLDDLLRLKKNNWTHEA